MPSRRTFAAGLLAAPFAVPAAQLTDPAYLTIADAGALIRTRKISPAELTEACLRRIDQSNSRLNAFITVLAEQALARARALSASAAGGPLHGIPIALKDLFDTAGIRTTAGSAHWRDRVPKEDAAVVRRLHAAGAVIVGKANLDEFAYNFTSETSASGAAYNPWNTECSPGGSSGGSAIAVASGMCLAALGSDTGGSIRLPASFCGITGFKPTHGRVPVDGAAPLAWSLDHIGPMTRTAADAALLHGVLSGQPPAGARPVRELRVGIPRDPYWQALDSDVENALNAAAGAMKAFTREIREVKLPPLATLPDSPLPAAYAAVIFSEALAYHRERLAAEPDRYHPGTRASIELGKPISAADYIVARREMEQLRASAATTLFRDVDLLITPTAPGPPFRLGSNPSLSFLRNTAPWNLYGLPTISIPCGFSRFGLPIGMQITGAPDRDGMVFALAAAYQSATDFHRRRPSS